MWLAGVGPRYLKALYHEYTDIAFQVPLLSSCIWSQARLPVAASQGNAHTEMSTVPLLLMVCLGVLHPHVTRRCFRKQYCVQTLSQTTVAEEHLGILGEGPIELGMLYQLVAPTCLWGIHCQCSVSPV